MANRGTSFSAAFNLSFSRFFLSFLKFVFVASSLSATVGVLGLFLFGWAVTPALSGLLTAGLVMGIVYDLIMFFRPKSPHASSLPKCCKFFQLLFHATLLSSVLQMSSTIAMGAFAAAFGGVACLYVATWLMLIFSAVKDFYIRLKQGDSNAGQEFVGYLIFSILILVMLFALCLPALLVPLMFSNIVGGETILIAVFLSVVLFAADQLYYELSKFNGFFYYYALAPCTIYWEHLIKRGSAFADEDFVIDDQQVTHSNPDQSQFTAEINSITLNNPVLVQSVGAYGVEINI